MINKIGGNKSIMNKILSKRAIVSAILVVTMFLSALSYGASAYAVTQNPGATLKLDPATGTYSSGTFNVAIKVDTGGEAINAVKAYLTFPADKLSVVSISTTGTFLTFWAENTYDNTTGTIHLQGGLPTPGYTGTDGLVATITFKVKDSGTANVSFDLSSEVLTNSNNTNILSNRVNGEYTLGNNTTSITLHIPSGWALISVPFDMDASLLSCQYVFSWDGSMWKTATTLHPGIGYLVLSSTSKDITLTGTLPSSPFTEPCTGSWQLIGNPFASPASLSSTSTIQFILYWDGSMWQPGDTNNLQPGKGYLVLTSSSGTFTFTLKP